ncbi:protein-lysine N-methyltransferase EEF2KMT-like isoform X2 [Hetaerina americana]|uniref:protein-lysine N-methyltransferase EEF2KMT-like isoform X2 n=1 Tax=Hetaerina americana TaxID=62018 RepID=UPI003A7F61A5
MFSDILAYMRGTIDDELSFQNALLKRTIHHRLMEKFPVKLPYRTMFLKTLINKMEESNIEVCDEIYEAYCQLLGESGNPEFNCQDKHFRHFILDRGYISLRESTSIVSEGTTGLHAWQASMALAEWCLQHQETILKNQRILELGSGIGLTGLACILGTAGHALKGNNPGNKAIKEIQPHEARLLGDQNFQLSGSSVCSPLAYTFSDCHPSVLQLLCGNVRQNLMEDIEGSQLYLENLVNGGTFLDTSYGRTKVRVVNLLWQDLEAGAKEAVEMVGQVDIVIAADVVYDHSLFKPLIGSLKTLATKCENGILTKVVLACTKRNPETLKEFMDCLTTYGLLAHEDKPVQPKYFLYDPDPSVGIYLISMQQCE